MHKILSVDDEPINQAIVEELFGEYFEVTLASSGEECLKKIDNIKPELILLDVSMPGIDGYQTCRELKTDESTRHIPVFFVSARSTLEDKIKGFEAGGYDYITKPFNHSELKVKIDHTIKTVNQSIAVARQHSQYAHETAPVAARYSRDTSAVIQFLDASFNCHSLDDLGQLLLNTCQYLQLNCTFQFRNGSDKFNYSSHSADSIEISPLELSLLEQTLDKERFFDFNTRTIVIFPHTSLLVKNMPGDDENRYDELKDLLNILLGVTESRLNSLLNEIALSTQYERVFDIIKENLTKFDQYSESLQKKSIHHIEDYSAKIARTLVDSGLNESQNAVLQSISKDFLEKANAIFCAELPLEEKIRTIQDALYKAFRQ